MLDHRFVPFALCACGDFYKHHGATTHPFILKECVDPRAGDASLVVAFDASPTADPRVQETA